MAFYDLPKEKRLALMTQISDELQADFAQASIEFLMQYFVDDDTYIRKAGYLAVGRIYEAQEHLQKNILQTLNDLFLSDAHHVRQTIVNAAGEIGKSDFEVVEPFFDRGLFDAHHTVRNTVIGSIKKMGEKNPTPVLTWAKRYLHHEDKEVRREICHGIELRGRTHPQDILPLLAELQHDPTARVHNTLVHVLGQIAYKKGCLETVVTALNHWENQPLVEKALAEIIDVHHRYRDFAILTQAQAIEAIDRLRKER